MSQVQTSPLPKLQFWLSLCAIGILVILMNIEFSAVNLALVPISKDIEAVLNDLQWVLSGYILVWGALVVPAGRLSDLYGKKKMLLIGLTTFLVGSLLAGMADSLFVIILGRLIQGMGAAFFSAPAYGIIFTTAPAHLQGLAIGIIASFGGFGLAIGPTLAGYLIDSFSWRWVFYINLPLGLVVFLTCFYLVPKDEASQSHAKINYGTSLLLMLGLAGFVGGINQIEVWGISNIFIWVVILGSLLILGLFYLLDQRSSFQTLPKSLLMNKSYRATLMTMMGLAYIFSLSLFQVTLYLQSILRFSAYEAGLIMMFFSVAYGLLSPIGGKIADKFGVQKPLFAGILSLVMGMGLLVFAQHDSGLIFLFFPLILLGIGLGVTFPAVNTAMFKTVPPQMMNTGSSLFTMLMMLGNTISVIISSSLLVLWGDLKLGDLLQKAGLSLSREQYQIVLKIVSKAEHSAAQLFAFPEKDVPTLLSVIDEAFMKGFHLNMMVGIAWALFAFYFVFRHLNLSTEPQSQVSQPMMH
jgi:EmrB/QacA subfamily drug resistance transporter